MDRLLADELKHRWGEVEAGRLTADAFAVEQDRLLDVYRRWWTEALQRPGEPDLAESLVGELAAYTGTSDREVIRARCRQAVLAIRDQWQRSVDPADPKAIEQFYDQTEAHLYELMWWHTLAEDVSPLAYVTALDFGRRHGCSRYLDFGSGVGSGGLLFARNRFAVTLADISSSLLRFCRWRFEQAGLPLRAIDLKSAPLPEAAFDLVTAMDVFEHLTDPLEVVDAIHRALRPGGYLFGRFAAEEDPMRPQHIVLDFAPVFAHLRARGFTEVWRDEWLWGHQVFQRA